VGTRTRVTVDPVAIQSQFVRGGDIHKKAKQVGDDVRTAARRLVGKRTRRLWRSISVPAPHTLPLGVRVNVEAFAPYALFHELGTAGAGAGTIPTKKPGALMTLYAGGRVPPAKYAHTRLAFAYEVRGQKPRLYLTKGLAAGLAKNGLL
jgi:hypothetical protein